MSQGQSHSQDQSQSQSQGQSHSQDQNTSQSQRQSNVAAVTGNDFAGAAERDDGILTLWLRGNADRHASDAIERLLTSVHVEARRLGIFEVIVDLRQLELMSSSCFRNFLAWLTDIQELGEDRRYKVKFVFNPGLHWQNRSLQHLRCFAIDLVSITEYQ